MHVAIVYSTIDQINLTYLHPWWNSEVYVQCLQNAGSNHYGDLSSVFPKEMVKIKYTVYTPMADTLTLCFYYEVVQIMSKWKKY